MASEYRRGFKAKAEKLALQVRGAMGLSWRERLDPRKLADHLGVPVFELPDLVTTGMSQGSVSHLLGKGRGEFSAALFQREGVKLIVANPVHSAGRQASNIVHEVSHLLLKHVPPAEVLEAGCRRWDSMMEREADWLAGELLVPRKAALDIARRGRDLDLSARHFGVSKAMMTWRLNHSGARKQAKRERAARKRAK